MGEQQAPGAARPPEHGSPMPSPSGGPWFLAVALAVVLAIGLTVAYETTREPGPTVALRGPAPQAASSQAAPPSQTPHPVYRLADNPVELDNLSLAQSTCVVPPYPSDSSGRATFYAAAKDCLDQAWQPLLSAAQLPFTPAMLVLFGDSVGTPCGEGVQAAGAFYCDGSSTIYVSPEKFSKTERISDNQTGVFLSIMAHEYGHHVQDLSGIFAAAGDQRVQVGPDTPAGLEISRRIELQANCFAGMFFAAVQGRGSVTTKVVRQASTDIAHRGDTKRGPADHGTFAHSAMWFERGRQANNTSACNTWAAPATEVS